MRLAATLVAALSAFAATAAEIPMLEPIEVRARADDLPGTATAASEGEISSKQLDARPLLRPAEVLEAIPGLVVTQHSGDGKANQYFLRGFNLDHGTDFFTSVLGMPVNLPSHAHGQGYADLNFLIPELVERVRYRKGPYHAEDGDFSSAGAAHIDYFRWLDAPFAEFSVGEGNYRRALVAGSPEAGEGHLLYGIELRSDDGPWMTPERLRAVNTVLRWSRGTADDGLSLAVLAYTADWNATDQVPQRAVDSGRVDRFGSLDPSDGGRTHRVGLSAQWAARGERSRSRVDAYLFDYDLRLWSNFTYALADPVNGDQFEQSDRRRVAGTNASQTWTGRWSGRDVENTLGAQARVDDIGNVGLYHTRSRERLATVREDSVVQRSVALYARNAIRWNEGWRTTAGLRGDRYDFDVASGTPANSGQARDYLWSPKLGVAFAPARTVELYGHWGRGFHSNDARGTTMTVEPSTGAAARRVPPLARSTGSELGLRTAPTPRFKATLALWRLDLDSELVFVGDAGTTEASRSSRRQGIESSAAYAPMHWLTLDGDITLSRARFTDADPAGDRIPGAVERTLSLGAGVDGLGRWFGGARLRYFGARPLVEDDSVRSHPSTLVNLRVGYRFDRGLRASLDVINALNRKVSDIDYFYCSRLPGEAPGICRDGGVGIDDVHTHPAPPRTLRLSVRAFF